MRKMQSDDPLCASNFMRNSGLQGDFLLAGQIGTIPILRHQKVWVGGFAKWQFLKMFSTIFMLLT